MKIKGPTKSKTHRTVEYFIWVPYSPVVNSLTPLATLTKYFTQGVADVLRKLEYPDEAIQKVLTHLANKQIQDNE